MTAISSSSYAPVEPPSPSNEYTIDTAIEAGGMGRFQYLLILLTGLCWTAESMEMLLLSFIKQPLQCSWSITDAQAATITTSVGVGMLIGSTTWGMIADRYGRRLSFILSTAVTFFLGVASALSPNYPLMLLLRGLVGFGIGGIPVAFSILMEFLPSSQRGTWGMAFAIFWSIGAIFEAAVAMAVLPPLGWRALVAVSSVPLGVVLIGLCALPESPRWLVARGEVEKAREVMKTVARVNGTQLPNGELVAAVEDVRVQTGARQLIRPGVRKLAGKIWILWFVAAFTYYGMVMLQPELIAAEKAGKRCGYADKKCSKFGKEVDCKKSEICIWDASGKDGKSACQANKDNKKQSGQTSHLLSLSNNSNLQLYHPIHNINEQLTLRKSTESSACKQQLTKSDFVDTLVASVGELPGILFAFAIINFIGRRAVISGSFLLTSSVFLILLLCLGRLAETMLFFTGRGASTAAFQAVYLYTNELYPAKIRATAMGVASSVARLGLITTPLVAQYLANLQIVAGMGLYGGFALIAAVVVLLIPIETTGSPLLDSMEQLVHMLRKREYNDIVEEDGFIEPEA